jgi:hypothetical protein
MILVLNDVVDSEMLAAHVLREVEISCIEKEPGSLGSGGLRSG